MQFIQYQPPYHQRLFGTAKKAVCWIWNHPPVLILAITILLLSKIILMGRLVYGDIPYFDVTTSEVNFLYAWGPEQFGTSVRQSFNTLRDAIILLVAWHDNMYYFIKYVLPIILVPLVYYWVLKRLGIQNRFALILGSLFPLFTPIVFGDFLTGQTFWVYLTVPFVFYFAIRIFCHKEFTLKNNVLLGLWLFLSLGMLPPIIIPLVAAVTMLAGVMLLTDFTKNNIRLVWQYALSGFTVGLVLFLLAAPYILVASSGQESHTPPSLLGDYYHNYAETNLVNTLRMAGNNGNGQSTLEYNLTSVTNVLGHILLLFILAGGIILTLRERSRNYRAMVMGLLVILFAILGFMHLLTTNTLIGIQVFESQWLVSTVRNPSKLFIILLPIFVILFGFSLQSLIRRARHSWQQVVVGILTVGLLSVYGWPAMRGDLGLLFQREDKIATYKQDPVVKQAAEKIARQDTRSLLLPANHRNELNYQYLSPGFNILRLEGGLPNTAELVDSLNSTLNDRSPYFFNYLDAAGIENMFIQKDPVAYESSLFDLFPVALSPQQSKEFAHTGLTLQDETPLFWQYKNQSYNKLLFSPQQLIAVQGDNSLKAKAPFLSTNTAVIDENSEAYDDFATTYISKKALRDGETITDGKAQLHDPRLLLVDLYAQWQNDKRYVVFDILDPITGALSKTLNYEVSADSEVLVVDNERYNFGDEKKRVAMRAGDYEMEIGALEQVPIDTTDPSFETEPMPKPADATPDHEGKPQLYSRKINEGTDGSSSLLLGSANHTAFVEKEFSVDDPAAQYLLNFDYKNLQGNAPTFTILQDEQSLMFDGGRLGDSSEWQQHNAYFQPLTDKKAPAEVKLFLYTEGNKGNVSENAFDALRLFKINTTERVPLSLPNYPPHYELKNYRHATIDKQIDKNLLDNASFEAAALWGEVGDASQGAAGTASIRASQTSDAAKGNTALKLESDNHTAYMTQEASHFKPNTVYKLSFRYKHVSGRKPAFAMWQDGASIAHPSKELGKDKGWSYFETYFVPDKNTTNLALYFYSRSSGEKTINLFDDVHLQPTSLVSSYLTKNHDERQQLNNVVESYQRPDPTLVNIAMRPGKGVVVLNESFHKGWQAYIVPRGQKTTSFTQKLMLTTPGKSITQHFTVNGFANGWWVDSSEYPELGGETYTIVLRYEPQKYLYGGFVGSSVVLISISGFLFYDWRKQRLLMSGKIKV